MKKKLQVRYQNGLKIYCRRCYKYNRFLQKIIRTICHRFGVRSKSHLLEEEYPPTMIYSPLCKIADSSLFGSFNSPTFRHSLFLNSAIIDVLPPPIYPPIIYAAESVDAVA